jgi:DNA mismatch repair ATPase MutS
LGDEPDNEKFGLSPEEREAAARPKDAAFYKKEISDWDVAQKLFKQEMDQYDKDEQEKLGVKNEIKYRTRHARDWFKSMTPEQRKEVEDAREKWNREGAPPESQAM